ncbi:MAG: hypothetical protein ACKO3F_08265 [Cyanobium sp.]
MGATTSPVFRWIRKFSGSTVLGSCGWLNSIGIVCMKVCVHRSVAETTARASANWRGAASDVAQRRRWIKSQQLLHHPGSCCFGKADLILAEQAWDSLDALEAIAGGQDPGGALGAADDVSADHDVAVELFVARALAHGDRQAGGTAGMLVAGPGYGKWIRN